MIIKKRGDSDSKNSVTEKINESKLSKLTLTIKSNEWAEPNFYNNYQVALDTPINNLKKISINGSYEFPLLRPSIDETHNTFSIIYKNDIIQVG